MRVALVEIADAGEETPALQREAAVQRQRSEERLFDPGLAVSRDRCRDIAEEPGIDIRSEGELRLAEIEAALAGTDLATIRDEACDAVGPGILRQVRVLTRDDDRDGRVEGIAAGRSWRRRRCRHLCGGFELPDARVEITDMSGVVRPERLELGAQGGDFVSPADCGQRGTHEAK